MVPRVHIVFWHGSLHFWNHQVSTADAKAPFSNIAKRFSRTNPSEFKAPPEIVEKYESLRKYPLYLQCCRQNKHRRGNY
jgi:hypothetical protein